MSNHSLNLEKKYLQFKKNIPEDQGFSSPSINISQLEKLKKYGAETNGKTKIC